jgi:hypothetical protein
MFKATSKQAQHTKSLILLHLILIYIYALFHDPLRNHGSVVGIATTLWAGQSGIRIQAGQDIFLFAETSRVALGPTQSPQ